MGESVNDIFTPEDLANELLEKLPNEVWEENKTFLDPACGDGNLLVCVLRKKLRCGHKPTDALKTLYGVEIIDGYTKRCKERLLEIVGNTQYHKSIVDKQIICKDFLDDDVFSEKPKQLDLFFK
jgi:hypothetical protein